MSGQKRSKPRWIWVIAIAISFSLTGCGMYPSKPGHWPHGVWGDVLQFVSHVIDFFGQYVGYGLALIIVTVLVRLLILPLMVKQIKFSKSMQQLQPQISEIRAKYKGDSQKIQQETMKLYQAAGFNPMAGCLPMIVQLPVLYALFGAIEGNVKLSQATFLHIFHLGAKDPTFILPILAGVTTYFSSRVMMTGNDSQQKTMLFIMPVFVFFMATRFPSGLSLYWLCSNVFTAVQTYFIRVRPAQSQAAVAASVGGGKPLSKSARSKVGASTAGSTQRTDGRGKQGQSGKPKQGGKPTEGANKARASKPKAGGKAASAEQGSSEKKSSSSQSTDATERNKSDEPKERRELEEPTKEPSGNSSGLTDNQPSE